MGAGKGPAGSRVRYTRDGHARVVQTSGAQWSDEAEERFFETLAATCNVTMAAAAAGFAHTTVYRWRLRRPAFAARWQAAIEHGFARLEAELLRAANDTLAGVAFDSDRPIPKMSIDQAMQLLREHRDAATNGARPGARARRRSLDEVRAGILKKVEAIRNGEREERREKAAAARQRRVSIDLAPAESRATGRTDRGAEP